MEFIKKFNAIRDEELDEEYRVGIDGVTEISLGFKNFYEGAYIVFKGEVRIAICYPPFWKAVE
jgi:hypothetical protein